jgi:hypothetical protein
VDYGGGHLGIWAFAGTNLGSPYEAFDAPSWGQPITNSRLVSGDFNGSGVDDLALFTDIGGGHMRLHILYGEQPGNGLQQVWDAPNWGFPISSMLFASGHFGYSTSKDITAVLDYGGGHLGLWAFPGTSPGSPYEVFDAPSWGQPITNPRMVTGDFNNGGYTDLSLFTDIGGGHMRQHVFYGEQRPAVCSRYGTHPSGASRSAA